MKERWAQEWSKKPFKVEILLSAAVTLTILYLFSNYLEFNEARTTVVDIHDPVPALFSPKDVTLITGVLIYVGAVAAISNLVMNPTHLVLLFKAYGLLIAFRLVAMFLLPLSPPENMIVLTDPLAEFVASQAKPLEKDLFFSGHTATMMLFALVTRGWRIKLFFWVATAIMAVLVVSQHVHYTIDVYMAPFVCFTAYSIATMIGMHRKK